MRVLMLTSSYPKYQGDVTAPFIESIAVNVAAQGHEVHVVAPFHPDVRRKPVERGVHLHFFNYVPFKRLNQWGYAESLEADVAIKKNVYAVAPAALTAATRWLWGLTGKYRFDVIQANWVIPNGPAALPVAAARRIPLVVSMHGSDVFVAEKLKPAGALAGVTYSCAGAVTACSTELMNRAIKLGADPARSRVIPYGVDPAEFGCGTGNFDARHAVGAADQPVIFAVGRLVYKKGFEYLIKAMPAVLASFPDARFVIAGGGDLEGELKELAGSLGVADRLVMPGSVERDKIPAYFDAADVFALPSVRDQRGNIDGLPNVLLEAMASGKAIVASRVAGIPDVLEDGVNAILVEERRPEEIAESILTLLRSPEKRVEMGYANRRRVEEELNWQVTARRYIGAFESAIARGGWK